MKQHLNDAYFLSEGGVSVLNVIGHVCLPIFDSFYEYVRTQYPKITPFTNF